MSRPSQVFQINPELVRIFEDLRTKNYMEKEKAAQELKTAYFKHIESSEEVEILKNIL